RRRCIGCRPRDTEFRLPFWTVRGRSRISGRRPDDRIRISTEVDEPKERLRLQYFGATLPKTLTRIGRGQDNPRQCHPAHRLGEARKTLALCHYRTCGQAAERGHRLRCSRWIPGLVAFGGIARTRSTATCSSSTRHPWSRCC